MTTKHENTDVSADQHESESRVDALKRLGKRAVSVVGDPRVVTALSVIAVGIRIWSLLEDRRKRNEVGS